MILKTDCFPALRGYILSLDLPWEDSVRHGEFEFTTSVGGERPASGPGGIRTLDSRIRNPEPYPC